MITPLPFTKEFCGAVLFDLDGVLTATAKVHAVAWKRMFDPFLEDWSREQGKPYRPFDTGADYLVHVDGKSRFDGVKTFLQARGIEMGFRGTCWLN
jgi:beta-phosphoglucomutase-like phosphatase (HAD superfamily)